MPRIITTVGLLICLSGQVVASPSYVEPRNSENYPLIDRLLSGTKLAACTTYTVCENGRLRCDKYGKNCQQICREVTKCK